MGLCLPEAAQTAIAILPMRPDPVGSTVPGDVNGAADLWAASLVPTEEWARLALSELDLPHTAASPVSGPG